MEYLHFLWVDVGKRVREVDVLTFECFKAQERFKFCEGVIRDPFNPGTIKKLELIKMFISKILLAAEVIG